MTCHAAGRQHRPGRFGEICEGIQASTYRARYYCCCYCRRQHHVFVCVMPCCPNGLETVGFSWLLAECINRQTDRPYQQTCILYCLSSSVHQVSKKILVHGTYDRHRLKPVYSVRGVHWSSALPCWLCCILTLLFSRTFYASAFCPVCLCMRPCVRPETLTWCLAEYLTHFHQTYIGIALWDRDERVTERSKVKS